MEFKKGSFGDQPIVLAATYVKWVVQVLTQCCPWAADVISVIPAVVAKGIKRGENWPLPSRTATIHRS